MRKGSHRTSDAPSTHAQSSVSGGWWSFCGAFRHLPFSAMFAYCLLQGLPFGVTVYFLQYFLEDAIETQPEGYVLNLFGLRYDGTQSAESATALVNIISSWSQLLTSLASSVGLLQSVRLCIVRMYIGTDTLAGTVNVCMCARVNYTPFQMMLFGRLVAMHRIWLVQRQCWCARRFSRPYPSARSASCRTSPAWYAVSMARS